MRNFSTSLFTIFSCLFTIRFIFDISLFLWLSFLTIFPTLLTLLLEIGNFLSILLMLYILTLIIAINVKDVSPNRYLEILKKSTFFSQINVFTNEVTSSIVCKFSDFSITQILREINLGECRNSKSAVFAGFGALTFFDLVNFSILKVHKIINNQIQNLKMCQNCRFCTSRIPNIDFT